MFNNLKEFKINIQNASNNKDERIVKAQRSQCRTTHKRKDC